MAFERFDKRAVGKTKQPTVTIQKAGTMCLNSAAAHILSGGETANELPVELFYDRERKIVGMRKATEIDLNVYQLRKQKNSDSYLLAGRRFTQYFGIDTAESRRYIARTYDDGILGVALDDSFATVSRGNDEEPRGNEDADT